MKLNELLVLAAMISVFCGILLFSCSGCTDVANLLSPDALHAFYGESNGSADGTIANGEFPIRASGDSEFWAVGLTWKLPQWKDGSHDHR